jgi:hypothetical protein
MRHDWLLAALLVACSSSEPAREPSGGACGELRRLTGVYHADQAFDSQERQALSYAADDLFRFTDGRVNFVVAYDLDAHRTLVPQILRTYSWEPTVATMEAEKADRYDVPSYTLMGNASRRTQTVVLVMDRIIGQSHADGIDPLWYLRLMATHELVHMAGWAWPGCSGDSKVCHHSPDPGALMNAGFHGASLGEADRVLCRASCFCR